MLHPVHLKWISELRRELLDALFRPRQCPLGNPQPNSVTFFAASEVLEQIKDRTWLARVTNALNQQWQKKNAARKNHAPVHPLPVPADSP